MSIYTDSIEAAYEILEDPSRGDQDHPGLFTELDVIALAAEMAGGYTEADFKKALTEANVALLKMFRRFEVTRFGPVKPPGADRPDYLRLATKIVYAHPEDGPQYVETPNGTFKRMMVWQDKHIGAGRRRSTNRDDFISWSDQDLNLQPRKRVVA